MTVSIRPFAPADRDAVNRIGVAAFGRHQQHYDDWPAFRAAIADMARLAQDGDLFVAERDGIIVGAVVHVGPGAPRQPFFPDDWSLIRMLSVDPAACGQGIGKLLTAACLQRAQELGAPVVGLHTSPVMDHALALYTRIGFTRDIDLAPISGLPYARYVLPLAAIPDALARLDAPSGARKAA
jgi:ribosomal protein S18 acetylase RimI-like enzyme